MSQYDDLDFLKDDFREDDEDNLLDFTETNPDLDEDSFFTQFFLDNILGGF